MIRCVPCTVGHCQRCVTASGASVGLPCQCEHDDDVAPPVKRTPGVRKVKRPKNRSMK